MKALLDESCQPYEPSPAPMLAYPEGGEEFEWSCDALEELEAKVNTEEVMDEC